MDENSVRVSALKGQIWGLERHRALRVRRRAPSVLKLPSSVSRLLDNVPTFLGHLQESLVKASTVPLIIRVS